MRLDTAERRRGAISMTSLIDVIFLLLLFFMLSSTFTRFGEIELTASGGGTGQAITPAYLRIQDGQILLNGQDTTLADLPATLGTLSEAGTNMVLMKLDEMTVSQRFVDVYAVLRAVPGLSVAVLR